MSFVGAGGLRVNAGGGVENMPSLDNPWASRETIPSITIAELAKGFYEEYYAKIVTMAETQFKKNIEQYLSEEISQSAFTNKHNQILKVLEDFAVFQEKRIYTPQKTYQQLDREYTAQISLALYASYRTLWERNISMEGFQKDQAILMNALGSNTIQQNPFIFCSNYVRIPQQDFLKELEETCFKKRADIKNQLENNEVSQSNASRQRERLGDVIDSIQEIYKSIAFKKIDFSQSPMEMLVGSEHTQINLPKSLKNKYSTDRLDVSELFHKQQHDYHETPPKQTIRVAVSNYAPKIKKTKIEKNKRMITLIIEKILSYFRNKKTQLNEDSLDSDSQSKYATENVEKNKPVLNEKQVLLNLYKSNYGVLEREIETHEALSHKEELLRITGKIKSIYTTLSVYASLDMENKFTITNTYPEILSTLVRQCAYSHENMAFTGQEDPLLPEAINNFEEKINAIFTQKLERDRRETHVLSSYLKSKK